MHKNKKGGGLLSSFLNKIKEYESNNAGAILSLILMFVAMAVLLLIQIYS